MEGTSKSQDLDLFIPSHQNIFSHEGGGVGPPADALPVAK